MHEGQQSFGYYAPLPPARSGVASYAAALARALTATGARLRMHQPGDTVDLYQIGNNGLHRDIYHQALRRPGVALIHDAVLHHLFLGAGDARHYEDEFVYNYGEWNRQLAQRLWRERAQSGSDPSYFAYPMLRRIAAASRAVLVHNAAAARMVRDHAGPSARVVEIPHLFEAPEALPPGYEIERLRAGFQLPAGGFLFGVFGHLRETKRLHVVLNAFARVRALRPGARLLVAGEFASAEYGRAMEPELAAQPGVIRVPYQEDESWFWRYAHAVDACINLRYPTAGETSGIGIRMMGIGKAVLVTAGDEHAAIPDAACLRIDAGTAEFEMLTAYMLWLTAQPEAARQIGACAAAHIRDRHSPQQAARLVLSTLSAISEPAAQGAVR